MQLFSLKILKTSLWVAVALHCYNIVVHDPGMFLILWCLEAVWLSIYGFGLYFLIKPSRIGYIYLTLLITINVSLEIWLGFLSVNEIHILFFSLFSFLLFILFASRHFFGVSNKFAFLAVFGVSLIFAQDAYFAFSLMNDKTGEISKWANPISTGKVIRGEIVWLNNNTIIGREQLKRSLNAREANEVGFLIIDTQKLTTRVINELAGYHLNASRDGRYIGYKRPNSTDPVIKGKISPMEYIRYDLLLDDREFMLHGIPTDRFNYMLSPSGNKVLFDGTLKDDTVSKDIIVWKNPKFQLGMWHPVQDHLVLVSTEADGTRVLGIYDQNGMQIERIPSPVKIARISAMKFSRDGNYLYVKGVNTDREDSISYYSFLTPEEGWKEVILGNVSDWHVGYDGTLLFTQHPNLVGQYLYLYIDKLGNRGIWLYRPGMTKAQRIIADPASEARMSPDGRTIVFLRAIPALSSQYVDHRELVIMRKK
jgi:hypothetical protein